MLRIVTAFVLFVFAAGVAVEACAMASSSVPGGAGPSAEPTISLPDGPAKIPSGTVEVPPPIN